VFILEVIMFKDLQVNLHLSV